MVFFLGRCVKERVKEGENVVQIAFWPAFHQVRDKRCVGECLVGVVFLYYWLMLVYWSPFSDAMIFRYCNALRAASTWLS